MSGRVLIMIHLLFAILCKGLVAQDNLDGKTIPVTESVKVSMIGDNESLQTKLNLECSDILLNIEELDMSTAYTVWLSMLSDLENYADNIDFDIKGLRLWMNVYWNENGTIRHIIYYPKPNSKNIDFEQFSNFMNGFAKDYILNVNHRSCFSHYGSASFPTFYEQLLKKD